MSERANYRVVDNEGNQIGGAFKADADIHTASFLDVRAEQHPVGPGATYSVEKQVDGEWTEVPGLYISASDS